jgi:membrane protein YdbS with pleckstrin-like domain
MSYLIFLAIGLGIIWWGLKIKEEIFQISSAIIGALFLVWGLILTPQSLLFAGEVISVVAVFRICVRCCECK